MKQGKNFTETYKIGLLQNIEDITKYLENKTGWNVEMNIELDKNTGYLYSIKISTESTFSKYTKWLITSINKQSIKKELLEKIANFDFQANKKKGSTTQRISKQVKSTSIKVDCINCGEVTIAQIHRNKQSNIYRARNGFVQFCKDCVNRQFENILHEQNCYTAFLWICALYDRKFEMELVNIVKELSLPPKEMSHEYFRRLNLYKSKQSDNKLFCNSEISLI